MRTLSIFSAVLGRGVSLIATGMMALALLGLGSQSAAAVTPGATITVNTTADETSPTDGTCSLREAILAANTNTASSTTPGECAGGTTSLDTIAFALTGGGPSYTITVLSSVLPNITAPVIIDGTTQASYSGTPLIILDPVSTSNGLNFQPGSAGSKVLGLSIVGFTNAGVLLFGGGVTLQFNWIGTSDGATPASDNVGIYVSSSNNIIGGLDSSGEPRTNLISGNTGVSGIGINVNAGSNNIIQGNFIGVTEDGLSALGNTDGIDVGALAVGTQIGGMKPNQGNVISGNTYGVAIFAGAKSTKIQRNFIGTDAVGLAAVPDGTGILDSGGVGTLIGGTLPQAGNLISGVTNDAVHFQGSSGNGTVTGNLMGITSKDDPLANGWGIVIHYTPSVIMKGNLITFSVHQGISIDGPGTPKISGSVQNCLHNNGYGFLSTLTPFMPFANNWWGVATGPNTGGDHTSGNVTVTPWLTTPPLSCFGWSPKSISPMDQSFKNKSAGTTKFSWSAVSTANDYHFTLSHNANLSSPIDDNLDLGTQLSHSDALVYGAYYWKTTTGTADGFAWPSPIHAFYVTTMTAPKPSAVGVTNATKFTWLATPGGSPYTLNLYDGFGCGGSLLGSAVFTTTSGSGFFIFATNHNTHGRLRRPRR